MRRNNLAKIEVTLLKALRIDIDAALLSVGQKHGVTIKGAGASYDRDGNSGNMKLEILSVTTSGAAVDMRALNFPKYCHMFGLDPSDFNAKFIVRGEEIQIIGIEPKRTTYPIVGKNTRTGKVMLYRDEDVKMALKHFRVGPAPVVPAPLFGNVPVSVPPIPAPKAPVAKKGFADSARIVTLTSTNPYKAGSKAANTFDLLASVGTVGKFKAAVAAAPGKYDPSYLTWCTAPHGNQPAYISIQ
jgi:hypothetical protein